MITSSNLFRRCAIWLTCALLALSPLQGRIQVVATTTMVRDLVASVGGDQIELTGLMGPAVDPHLYKATSADIRQLQRADAIFYNGLHLEGNMARLLEQMAERGRPVYALADGVEKDALIAPQDGDYAHDPHIWFDPRLWLQTVSVVVEGLSQADPANTAVYQQRGTELEAAYEALFDWAQEAIGTIPESRRVLITSHDAYNYFGRAFGFEVVGVQGISTASEAGLADIASMTDFIRQRGIPAIFVESSVNPAAIRRISEDSGAKIGGELFSDAMGKPGEMETWGDDEYDLGTYEGMLKHNINRLVDALR